MTTNAQAALQAAATVHAGSKGYTSAQTVTNMAFQFKNWLDTKDRQDAEKARPGPKHFLTEDHNGDPVCHCGWDPAKLYLGLSFREEARQHIRQHIADLKPILPPDGTVPGR